MIIDRLSAFMGKPTIFNGLKIHSPTINKIVDQDNAEAAYRLNLTLASFDKERILLNLFQFPEEAYVELSQEDDYEVLTDNPVIAEYLANGIEFFVEDKVIFDKLNKSFISNGQEFINRDNYKEFSGILKQLNGVEDSIEKSVMKFKNDKSKKLFEMLNKMRKKVQDKKDNGLELKDILSILCNSEGNGINIFNVGDLSIYQVYEHFERESIQYNRKTLLPVWANGYLKEGEKLPETLIKTKF